MSCTEEYQLTADDVRWAWQNFHVTKHIADDQRLDWPIKRPGKKSLCPLLTLERALTNLHLLLRVPSFNRWPLALRFFCIDIYEEWLRFSNEASGELRDGLRVHEPSSAEGIECINVTYSTLQPHVEKSVSLRTEKGTKICSICAIPISSQTSTVLTCPSERCRAMSHMTCLAQTCSEGGQADEDLVPIRVRCPECNEKHQWVDLVKELSIRIHGEKDPTRSMKASRARKSKTPKSSTMSDAVAPEDDHSGPAERVQSLGDGITVADLLTMETEDVPLSDSWHELEENDDNWSVASTETGLSSRPGSPVDLAKQQPKLEIVIEDSEWDSAEVLD